jgi:hypothetical protein
MVEGAIKEAGAYPSKRQLWKSLPREVQYQTFGRIIDYLESSDKILKDGRSIVWVFPDNPKLKRLIEESVRLK